MQFRDLKKQHEVLSWDITEAMLKVAHNCNFISGAEVGQLEEELAEYVGVKHCITCGNGTDALTMAMMALGVGKGDAVFVPDFTFFASGETVSFAGATPVFVDVSPKTFNICPTHLEAAIEKVQEEGVLTPKAVVAVDLFGLPANFKKLRELANKYNLYIIEDGAQGFGGAIDGKRACSFGDIATTSFFPAKPLGCYGDGGAVFTDNDQWADFLKSIRVHGKGSNKYDNIRIGLNSRLDTIQAAVLQVKLKAFKEYELNSVNHVAEKYTEGLKSLEKKMLLKTPYVPEGFLSSWAQYTIQLCDKETRDGLQAHLKAKDIPTMIYYPKPMSKQEAFGQEKVAMPAPTTERLIDTVLSLPMHPYLEHKDIDLVCQTIEEYFKNK